MEECEKCEQSQKLCSKCCDEFFIHGDLLHCTKCQGFKVYLDEKQICRYCPKNCVKCKNESFCYECADGFYRNSENICSKCEGPLQAWDVEKGNKIVKSKVF